MSGVSSIPIRSWRLPALEGWTAHLRALGLSAGLILLIFHRDAAGMAEIWWDSSTFGHCLIIPFILFWLVQQRAGVLRAVEPQPWWPGLLLVGAGSFGWLLGQAGGVALFRHAGLVFMLQGSVIALLGPKVSRGLAFPIFYALFLIPFGEEMVPTLQMLTAHLTMFFLGVVGLPAHMEGVFITTPTGYFEVAEACSGAKFVIAMTAYSVLVGNVCFKTWRRRIAFLAFALITAIIANGMRAAGTIVIAHLFGVEWAQGFDHIVYGWVFFGLVIVGVMAAAWRFFDRGPNDSFLDAQSLRGEIKSPAGLVPVALTALAIALVSPLWSYAVAATGERVDRSFPAPEVRGWQQVDAPPRIPWSPHFVGADHIVQQRYRNAAGDPVDLAMVTFDRQEEGRELVGFGQGAVAPHGSWAWAQPGMAPANARGDLIAGPGAASRHVVTFYVIDGVVTGSALTVKLHTLKLRLLGGEQRAAAILVSTERDPAVPDDKALEQFLVDVGSIKSLADRAIGIR